MPFKPHPIKYTLRTALLPQITPVQLDTEPAQATLVAVAPSHSQPDMAPHVPGQLVMPCLKTHKALASDCCWLELGAMVGDIEGDADKEGDIDGDIDGAKEGDSLGFNDSDGDKVGLTDGCIDGMKLGLIDGDKEGAKDGDKVGAEQSGVEAL